jgi:hypothetical protein
MYQQLLKQQIIIQPNYILSESHYMIQFPQSVTRCTETWNLYANANQKPAKNIDRVGNRTLLFKTTPI